MNIKIVCAACGKELTTYELPTKIMVVPCGCMEKENMENIEKKLLTSWKKKLENLMTQGAIHKE